MGRYRINPITGKLDDIGDPTELNEIEIARLFIRLDGSNTPVTGDVIYPSTGYIMDDGTDLWRVTINSSGAIVTTKIV